MGKTYNLGEWGENFGFFKTLYTGRLTGSNGIGYYRVKSISRKDVTSAELIVFTPIDSNGDITRNGVKIRIPDMELLLSRFYKEVMYEKDNKKKKSTFSSPSAQKLLDLVGLSSVKAASSQKEDLKIRLEYLNDHEIKDLGEFGYSIKSDWGASPSLFNATKNGRFVYRVELNGGLTRERLEEEKGVKGKVKLVLNSGGRFLFEGIPHEIFNENVSIEQQNIIASMMITHFGLKGSLCMHDLMKIAYYNDNLGKRSSTWERNLGDFLFSCTCGMTASTEYSSDTVTAGFLEVQGDVVKARHMFSKEDLKDYLKKHAIFDTGSRDRHDFGSIYEEEGNLYLDLVLLIKLQTVSSV